MTHLMGADLSNIVKTQKLTDDHVQFLVYQLLRGLKVGDRLPSDVHYFLYCSVSFLNRISLCCTQFIISNLLFDS